VLGGSKLEENNESHSESEQGQEGGRNSHRPVYPVAEWVIGCIYLGLAGWAFWLAATMPGRWCAPWLRYVFGTLGVAGCLPLLSLILGWGV